METATVWFGILGGAVAWTLHLLGAYLIAEFGCELGIDRRVYGGINIVAWSLLGTSAVMVAVAAASCIVGWRIMARKSRGGESNVRERTNRELARTGAVANGLFTFVIAIQSIPIVFYLRSC